MTRQAPGGTLKRIARVVAVLLALVASAPQRAAAADEWTETKSTHFTIWSNAGDGQTRDLLWQFEQIRFCGEGTVAVDA
jgi:hypothetical protein